MVEFEADDAIGTAAARFATDPAVERILICTPDKDMAQCVVDDRIVLRDRRRQLTYDDAGVLEKWGVAPASIPDWLALVGDSSDGFPGLPGWGAKSAAAVLRRYGSIDDIPARASEWDVKGVSGAVRLAAVLNDQRDDALLYRTLARLRLDAPLPQQTPAELEWRGTPRAAWEAFCDRWGLARLRDTAASLARRQRAPARRGRRRVSPRLSGRSRAQRPVVVRRRRGDEPDRRVTPDGSYQAPPSNAVTVAPPARR